VISCERVRCWAAARRRSDSFSSFGTYAPIKTPFRFAIYLCRSPVEESRGRRQQSDVPCKPNSVFALRRTAIIHLGRSLPNGSSGLPENDACLSTDSEPGRFLFVFLFGLAPRGVYLAASVTTRAGELLPHRFTHHLSKEAGLFSVALVVTRCSRAPGCYPARCPLVFGLSSPLARSDRPARPTAWLINYSKKMLNNKQNEVNEYVGRETRPETNAPIYPARYL